MTYERPELLTSKLVAGSKKHHSSNVLRTENIRQHSDSALRNITDALYNRSVCRLEGGMMKTDWFRRKSPP